MAEYALRLANGVDTAVRVRMADAIPLLSNGSVGGRSGLRNDGGGAVAVVAGSMQVTVSPFVAWVNGGTSNAQGGYPFILDAQKTLTLADGNATQSRTDTIAVVVHDNAFDGSGLTDASVVVVQGTPGAGAPALPATALPLRNVTVPAGLSAGTGGLSSSNLSTDRRMFLPSGITRVSDATVRDALTVERGTAVWNAATGKLEVWNGAGKWEAYKKDDGLKTLTGTVTLPSGNSPQSGTFTFPESFSAAPVVQVNSTNSLAFASATNATPTDFTVFIRRFDENTGGKFGSSTPVTWTAVGPA